VAAAAVSTAGGGGGGGGAGGGGGGPRGGGDLIGILVPGSVGRGRRAARFWKERL